MTDPAPTTGPVTPAPAAAPALTPAPAAAPELQKVEDLPEWARKTITDSNAEAAKYRTEKNSAVEAAKTELATAHAAELETVKAETATAQADAAKNLLALTKLQVALKAEVPSSAVIELADLLKGETEAELTASVEKVKKIFGITATAATDPTQGLAGHSVVDTAPGLARLQHAYSNPS